MHSMYKFGLRVANATFLILAFSAVWAVAGETNSLIGRVLSAGGDPVTDARLTLVELRRKAATDENGEFRFEGIPDGSYLLQAHSDRYGGAVEKVEVWSGLTAPVDMRLDLRIHLEEIVVSASPDPRLAGEVYQPVGVLTGKDLDAKLEATLGETLSREPGVTSTFFGPGASRPVIRGLGGDRIRILEGGIGTGDASNASPDHAVSTEPLTAERIEILRGPSTLLYGSSAVGGIVNVIDNRVPDHLPEKPVTGTVVVRFDTVADERSGAASLLGALGGVAWHVDASKRSTDDYHVPDSATENGVSVGVIENSELTAKGATVGLSLVGMSGFIGASYGGFDTLYGIPGFEEEDGERVAVSIDLKQRRYDVRGGRNEPFWLFRGLKASLAIRDYEHVELEGEEVGTRFTSDSWETRVELPHRAIGPVEGSIGVQVSREDFAAAGAEAFIPPNQNDSHAIFAIEEVRLGRWKFQFGGRFDAREAALDQAPSTKRTFKGVSGSTGVVWEKGEDLSITASVSRSVKHPNPEELFANGPHAATETFEIGDSDLNDESSVGFDLSLRGERGRFGGDLNLYANLFNGFIFPGFTAEEEEGLPLVRFVQRDANFYGFEAHGDIEIMHSEPHHLSLELSMDYVRATLRDGEPLPRIPPLRFGTGLHYQGKGWTGSVELRHVRKQDRVAAFEEPTAGYTTLDGSVGYRLFLGTTVSDILLRASNITNEEARNHVSFLKDIAPLPGRNMTLSYRFRF